MQNNRIQIWQNAKRQITNVTKCNKTKHKYDKTQKTNATKYKYLLLKQYRGVTIENRRAAKRTATRSALLYGGFVVVFCRICILSFVFCHICELSFCVLSDWHSVFLHFVIFVFCLFIFCHFCISSFCILSFPELCFDRVVKCCGTLLWATPDRKIRLLLWRLFGYRESCEWLGSTQHSHRCSCSIWFSDGFL